MDYQIFISYKRENWEIAERLFNNLTEQGYIVFWDRAGINRGGAFNDIIEKAINASKLFVLLLSKSIVKAKEPYIKKEVSFALKWLPDSIYPFIIDDSSPEEYKDILPELFERVDLGHSAVSDDEMRQLICSKMDSMQIYPGEEARKRYDENRETKKTLQSINAGLRSLLKKCKECKRYSSTEYGKRCPFIRKVEEEPDSFVFEKESIKRTQENLNNYPAPEPEDNDSFEAWNDWNQEREHACMVYPKEIRSAFEKEFGDGHTGASISRPCDAQKLRIDTLEKHLNVFKKSIFQQDLIEFEKDFEKVKEEINEQINKLITTRLSDAGFDLDTYIRFVQQQLTIKWNQKRDALDALIQEKGFDSVAGFLVEQLRTATSYIKEAIDNCASIPADANLSIISIWWLLRGNSCFLTQNLISSLPDDDQRVALKEGLERFREQYERLLTSNHMILFESAIPLSILDTPEDDLTSPAYGVFGFRILPFQWHELRESCGWDEVEYYCATKSTLDPQFNPIFSKDPIHLSRGIEHVSNKNNSLNNVIASNYLYPIVQHCKKSLACLTNDTMSRDTYPTRFVKHRYFIPLGCDPYDYDNEDLPYSALLSITSFGEDRFNRSVEAITNGDDKGVEMMDVLIESQDLEAVVFMANYHAHKQAPDYLRAIKLYEFAAENGIEFCYSRLAECYERTGNYREAYKWYSLANHLSPSKDISLRLGVCCHHLNDHTQSLAHFNQAGEKGQAAIYFLDLYLNPDNDNPFEPYHQEAEQVKQLSRALGSRIKLADQVLGDFQSIFIHFIQSISFRVENISIFDGDIDDLKENDFFYGILKTFGHDPSIDDLKKWAKENDSEAQFYYGILQMKEHIASDVFYSKALNWIRLAANNGNPYALCFLGRYLQTFRNEDSDGFKLLEKALRLIYPEPFPELTDMPNDTLFNHEESES